MLGQSAVDMAEQQLSKVAPLVDGDRNLVRLNLIAFFVYAWTWGAAGRLEGDALRRFRDGVARTAADRSGLKHTAKALSLLLNRYDGFAVSLERTQTDEEALSNYFQACCSVNRINIGPDDVYLHPDDMDSLARTMSEYGGSPTADFHQLKAKVLAMNNPATYRANYVCRLRLFDFLTSTLIACKEIVDSFDL